MASIELGWDDIAASIGATSRTEVFVDPVQRVKVAFLGSGVPGEALVELVEPIGEKSPVACFLAQGGGLHHLCYEVANLEAEILRQKSIGSTLIRAPQAAVAFDGRRIAWMYTKNKLVLEFLESKVEDQR